MVILLVEGSWIIRYQISWPSSFGLKGRSFVAALGEPFSAQLRIKSRVATTPTLTTAS